MSQPIPWHEQAQQLEYLLAEVACIGQPGTTDIVVAEIIQQLRLGALRLRDLAAESYWL